MSPFSWAGSIIAAGLVHRYEVVVGAESHVYNMETGALAALCQVQVRPVSGRTVAVIGQGPIGLLFTHVYENVGMTVNLMPITGIPLPFFSYGGSFMLASWLAIGVLMRISGEGRGKAAFKAS